MESSEVAERAPPFAAVFYVRGRLSVSWCAVLFALFRLLRFGNFPLRRQDLPVCDGRAPFWIALTRRPHCHSGTRRVRFANVFDDAGFLSAGGIRPLHRFDLSVSIVRTQFCIALAEALFVTPE